MILKFIVTLIFLVIGILNLVWGNIAGGIMFLITAGCSAMAGIQKYKQRY
jgi:hypothetical protein